MKQQIFQLVLSDFYIEQIVWGREREKNEYKEIYV